MQTKIKTFFCKIFFFKKSFPDKEVHLCTKCLSGLLFIKTEIWGKLHIFLNVDTDDQVKN